MIAIDSQTIAVFGGIRDWVRQLLNDGYLLDTVSNDIRPILGNDLDLPFSCSSLCQRVDFGQYITVGYGIYKILHMVRLFVS